MKKKAEPKAEPKPDKADLALRASLAALKQLTPTPEIEKLIVEAEGLLNA